MAGAVEHDNNELAQTGIDLQALRSPAELSLVISERQVVSLLTSALTMLSVKSSIFFFL